MRWNDEDHSSVYCEIVVNEALIKQVTDESMVSILVAGAILNLPLYISLSSRWLKFVGGRTLYIILSAFQKILFFSGSAPKAGYQRYKSEWFCQYGPKLNLNIKADVEIPDVSTCAICITILLVTWIYICSFLNRWSGMDAKDICYCLISGTCIVLVVIVLRFRCLIV